MCSFIKEELNTINQPIDEFLAFRHIFRNIYGFELESDRLDILANKFEKTAQCFQREIEDFIHKL